MLEIRRRRTADLTAAELDEIRALLGSAFAGRFDDHDWDHTLGGHHVQGFLDGLLVAHASVVGRTLWIGETPARAGYVEAVAVDPSRQRHGYGTRVMAESERIIRAEYELGALSAGETAQILYHRLGWVTWRGPSFVRTANGRVATPDEDGYLLVLPQPDIDLTAPITCDWRPGDVW